MDEGGEGAGGEKISMALEDTQLLHTGRILY
eukprot:COSAG01_NODE_10978_length_2035_cov_1.490702_1_plen_30_part_10